MGTLKSACTTSYRSSIETMALDCLVFEKIAFFCILATEKQTDNRWTASTHLDAHSRCHERRCINAAAAETAASIAYRNPGASH